MLLRNCGNVLSDTPTTRVLRPTDELVFKEDTFGIMWPRLHLFCSVDGQIFQKLQMLAGCKVRDGAALG